MHELCYSIYLHKSMSTFLFTQNVKSKDTLLFYFSGHGIPEGEDNYFASSEINIEEPYDKGYSSDDLTKMINRSVSTRIVIILDCC